MTLTVRRLAFFSNFLDLSCNSRLHGVFPTGCTLLLSLFPLLKLLLTLFLAWTSFGRFQIGQLLVLSKFLYIFSLTLEELAEEYLECRHINNHDPQELQGSSEDFRYPVNLSDDILSTQLRRISENTTGDRRNTQTCHLLLNGRDVHTTYSFP